MRYLITFSYDGTNFNGYQKQPNLRTIQGELESALKFISGGNDITVNSSGRTDKGVHALNQKAHFDLDKNITCYKLKCALNTYTKDDIYIKSVEAVADNFHARYNVSKKEYIYKINMNEYNPIEKDYVYQYNKKIPKELLDKFISKMNGKHNFKSFTSDKDKKSYERILKMDYKITKGILYLRFESSGFFRYMIRNIVGLLLDINNGKKSINDIDNIFKSENRISAGICASPVGLYLNKIYFDKRC